MSVFGTDYPTPDGSAVRDYVHVSDLAAAHAAALERLPAATGTYNLGSGRGASVLEVLAAVRRVSGLPLTEQAAPRRAGDPAMLVARPEHAGQVLGWRTRRSLEDAVADAWAWMEGRPLGYGEAG